MDEEGTQPQAVQVERFEDLDSTNEEALRRGRAGLGAQLWVVARRQSRGRGRLGRSWASPAGNLHASLLLPEPCEQARAAELGFVAGVALARALRGLTGADIRIKWPNDLLWRGAKLAGVLVEATRLPDGRFVAAIGFGVNCATHPTDLPYPATDLAMAAQRVVDPDEVFSALSREVAKLLRLWDCGDGFAAVREAWIAAALPRGAGLTVRTSATTLAGRFDSIDAQGRLLLDTDDGSATIEAADIALTQPLDPIVLDPR